MLVVVVVVFLTGGFCVSGLLFLATGTPPWLLKLVKTSTSSELYPGYFRLLYFCQVFSSHFYRERYGFEWAFFTHRRFFSLHSFPTFLARFCDSDVGRNAPSRMDLNYSYCQALSGDFQCACCKMQAQILLGVRWCAMSIFLFLKFYNFIKGIMRIDSIFKKPKTNVFILHLLTF